MLFFFFQAEDGIRDKLVTGVQTCALPISQVARLLLIAVGWGGSGACANQGEPPGGPPDTTPPQVVRTIPESGAVVPALKDDAGIQFGDVIDEMAGGGGGAGGRGRAGGGRGARGPGAPGAG